MSQRNTGLAWGGLCAVIVVPIALAAFSPLLAWRGPIYILAGFAGIVGMAAMVVQALAALRKLPGVDDLRARQIHRIVGAGILGAVLLHVIGLWIFSPPDVIDALLLRSPTPFSIWGVIGMWAIFGAGALALSRLAGRVKWKHFRKLHPPLAVIAMGTTIVHVQLIDGTMEIWSKRVLCIALGLAGVALARTMARRDT